MRLSELARREVVTTDGRSSVGCTTCCSCRTARRLPGSPGLRLHGLAVGRRAFGTQLGYSQGTVKGPCLLQRPVRAAADDRAVGRDRQPDDERIVVDATGYREPR